MRQTLRFLARTFVRGVLFLAPILLLVILVREAVRAFAALLSPVASHIPIPPLFGMNTPQIAAAILLVLIGVLAGLIANIGLAARLNHHMEQLILRKMPGYTLFKSITESAAGLGGDAIKVALANIDDAWLIGFIIEQHPSGMLTVFVPSAPTPTAGSIYYLTELQIKRVDVPVSEAVKCIMQLGVGSRQLLDKARLA